MSSGRTTSAEGARQQTENAKRLLSVQLPRRSDGDAAKRSVSAQAELRVKEIHLDHGTQKHKRSYLAAGKLLSGVVRYTHYLFLVFGFGRIPIILLVACASK